jgi:hypothetical protein
MIFSKKSLVPKMFFDIKISITAMKNGDEKKRGSVFSNHQILKI